jgi:hypothetical protein
MIHGKQQVRIKGEDNVNITTMSILIFAAVVILGLLDPAGRVLNARR